MAKIITLPLGECRLFLTAENEVSFRSGDGDEARQVDIIITNGQPGELAPLEPLEGQDVRCWIGVEAA